jgi:FAD/FMN-containing dehydrogenase
VHAQVCSPAATVRPTSEEEIVSAVSNAPGPVRVAGSGHSFSPIVLTDGTLIDLSGYTGLVAVDAERYARACRAKRTSRPPRALCGRGLATVRAGTPLHEFNSLLEAQVRLARCARYVVLSSASVL